MTLVRRRPGAKVVDPVIRLLVPRRVLERRAMQGSSLRVRKLDFDRFEINLHPTPAMPVPGQRAKAVVKEPWTVRWLIGSMSAGDVLWDIGANVGPYSLIAARAVGPEATVVAVEPGGASFDALIRNIVHNRAYNIVPLCVALGDTDGIAEFEYASLVAGEGRNAFAKTGSRVARTNAQAEAVNVPVLSLTLDTLVEKARMPRPTHIKLDIEGGELAVLAGGLRTLTSSPPHSLMVEADDEEQVGSVQELLAPTGLELAVTFWKSPRATAVDAFFARDPAALRGLLAGISDRRPS